MISTITVDLVERVESNYLTGASKVIDTFKDVKLKLYYNEEFNYISCEMWLPKDDFLKKADLTNREVWYEQVIMKRYRFQCVVNEANLLLPRGRLDTITDTEVEFFFDTVQIGLSEEYKHKVSFEGAAVYNLLVTSNNKHD